MWRIDGEIFSTAKVDKIIPEASRGMRHVGARLRHMDELGVEVQVLYPTLFLQPLTKGRLRVQGDVRTEDIDKILWDNPKALYNI